MTSLRRYYSTIKTFNIRGTAIFLLLFVLALPLLPFLFLFSACTQDRLQSRLAELLRAINSRGNANKANIRIASFRWVKVALSSMVLIGIFILCLVSLPNSVSTESPPPEATAQVKQGSGSKQSEALINTPHRIFAPHWSNENGTTTIYIRNIDIRQGVFARLSLILKNRTITLPETYIDSLQTISIDLAQSLMLNGERDDQSGGAILDFEAESDSALVAYAQIVNPDKGLSLNFPFLSGTTPAMPGGPTHPGPLETVAWYLNDKTDAFIALQNTTDKPAIAIPIMFISGRAVSLGQRQLKPHEPITIKLPSPYMSGYEKGQRSAMIRVEYKGEAGAVEAEGWVVNEEIGFSAALTFHRKIIDCHCPDGVRHLYGTGIAIGRGAMMGLTPGAVFSPYLAMGNRSGEKITINPIFSYHLGDDVEKVSLPPVSLNPQESALVNLQEYQESGIIPSTVSDGSIDLQYRGEAGALMAELASVDEDGSFVSPVPLTCNGQRLAEMAFWRTDGDWHSSLSFWNVAAEKMRLEIKISYPGGEYEIEKEIAAGAAAMVSVNELQESQEPDGEGRTIPAGVTMGGVSIRSKNKVNGLVMNAMLVNPVAKTCAECGGYGYVRYCVLTDDITSTATHKYTIHRAVNETFPMYIVVTYSTGFREIDNAEIIGNTNPSVAVASGGTIVTTVNPGTTKLTGRTYSDYYPLDRFCSVTGRLETSGDLQVLRVTFQKADGSALPSPLRVGISTSDHDRKQTLKAVIEPSSFTGAVIIIGSEKLDIPLQNQSRSGNVVTFTVVGTSKSESPGDQTMKAVGGGGVIGTATVSVVVPWQLVKPANPNAGSLIIQNMALNVDTSPALIDVPSSHFALRTVYMRNLTITVKDQFGALIGDLYAGAEIMEEVPNTNTVFKINQTLTSESTYTDPVGPPGEGTIAVPAGDPLINTWPSQPKIPLRSGTQTGTQSLSVFVDGFRLTPDPAINNRMITAVGDGQSTTSPPISVTISWP